MTVSMKSMKREALIAAMLVAYSTLHSQILVLHHSGGDSTYVDLMLQPRVEFVGDKVLITSSILDMEYPKENILRFTYKGKDTRINSPKANLKYSKRDGRLVFYGVKSTDKVAIYKVNGIRVPVSLTSGNNCVELSLGSIPSGVYLLNVNGKTSKFTKP